MVHKNEEIKKNSDDDYDADSKTNDSQSLWDDFSQHEFNITNVKEYVLHVEFVS